MAERLLAGPTAAYDISANVAATIAEYKGKDWPAIMKPNVETVGRLASDLERRGSRIVFFELPSPPELRTNQYVVTANKFAREAFANPEQWIDVDDFDLHWVDASHMDERSAVLVARQLDSHLARLLTDCRSAC
jgi:hypothetical protein